MFTLLLTKLMKKLTICWTLLTIYGCTQPALNSSSAGCLDKPPVSLAQEDVEEIKLNDKKLTTSGQVSSTKSMGYKFDANSGQKLSYATNADICLWVYTPDNQIIKTTELPKNGKYIIQVSAPQGLRTFDLEMTLSSVEVSSTPAPVTSPSNEISANTFSPQPAVATTTDTSNVTPTGSSIPKPRRTPSYTPSPSFPVSPAEPVHDISQKQALEIVQNWYAAKPQIFGPPYDTSLVEELTTGKLYSFTTKPNGPVAWLENNNAYYTYEKSEITKIIDFSNSGKRPYMKVKIFEELYLHGKNGIDKKNSGPYRGEFIYTFEKENGIWKIYDYKKVS
jgi:hypothetical protein